MFCVFKKKVKTCKKIYSKIGDDGQKKPKQVGKNINQLPNKIF